MIIQGDIFVQVIDMPTGFGGHVNSNKDGSYTIFLNAKLAREEQEKAYLHELGHIINGDFGKDGDVSMLEFFAHNRM